MAAKTTTTSTKRRLVDSTTNNSKTTETSSTTTPETASCNISSSGPSTSVIVSASSFTSESSSSTTSASSSVSHDDVADVDTAPSKKKTSYHNIPTIPWSMIQITEESKATTTIIGSKRKKKTTTSSSSSESSSTPRATTTQHHPHHPSLTGFHYLEATILPPHPLSGLDYYILQQQKQDVDVSKLLEKIPRHPNILKVHAQVKREDVESATAAGDFLVVDPWEETLRQRIMRLQQQHQKKKTSSSKSKSKSSSSSSSDSTATTMQMIISEIALPLIRVLKHLHHSNPRYAISYNVLCKDSVGFLPVNNGGQQEPSSSSSSSSNGVPVNQGRLPASTTNNLVLIDFSKATVSSSSSYHHHNHRESDDEDTDSSSVSTPSPLSSSSVEEESQQYYTYMNNQLEESFDVWCYGKLLREVLVALHVMPKSTSTESESNNNDPMFVLLEECCHSRPSKRPTLSRIHKRLLELYKPLSTSAVVVSTTAPAATTTTTTTTSPKSPKNLPRFKIGGWNWMTTTKLQRSPKKTSGNKTTHNNESIDISSLMTTTASLIQGEDEEDHSDNST